MFQKLHLRSELIAFLSRCKGRALALTFTYKQSQRRQDNTLQRIRRIDASKNNTHFLKILNKQVYGRAYAASHKALNCVVTIEKGHAGDKRLHTHMLLYYPDYVRTEAQALRFKQQIKAAWDKGYWSYGEYRMEEATDPEGWLRYITKEGMDAVDITNTVLDGRRNFAV